MGGGTLWIGGQGMTLGLNPKGSRIENHIYTNNGPWKYVDIIGPLKCLQCGQLFYEQHLPQLVLPPWSPNFSLWHSKPLTVESTFPIQFQRLPNSTPSLECRHYWAIIPQCKAHIHTLGHVFRMSPLCWSFPDLLQLIAHEGGPFVSIGSVSTDPTNHGSKCS